MSLLLRLSRLIDALNNVVGRIVLWLVLVAVLISAGNAIVRKAFMMSSNAFLEIQWYLFAAVFLLVAGYTLLHNEHVRIDVISGRLSVRGRMWVDIVGILLFLMPTVVLVVWLGWPFFMRAWVSGEMSSNAGGLIRWPAYLMIPLGFVLLGLQGVSELIKRVACLKGLIPDPTARRTERSAEQDLAEFLRRKNDGETHPSSHPLQQPGATMPDGQDPRSRS